MKQAVVAMIEREGLYLAINRPNDPSVWGLPGGKVEPRETATLAVCREVCEEVGLITFETWWTPVFVGGCRGDVDYWVSAFLWDGSTVKDSELEAEIGMALTWLTRDQLCDPNVSPFSDYNVSVFNALDHMRRFENGNA